MTSGSASGGGVPESTQSERIPEDALILWPSRKVAVLLERLVFLSRGAFTGLSARLSQLGHYGLVWGSMAFALFVLVENFIEPLWKILIVSAVLVSAALGQFAARRFTGLCEVLVRNTPTRTSNVLIFQFLGLLMVLGAAAIVVITLMALRGEDSEFRDTTTMSGFVLGIATAISLLVPGLLLLDPEGTLHVRVDSACTAGEDGLGLIGTLLKGYLAGVRLIFGGLCLLGGAAVVSGVLLVLFWESRAIDGFQLCFVGIWMVFTGAATPLLAYIVSVLYYILVDVLTAVIRRGRHPA